MKQLDYKYTPKNYGYSIMLPNKPKIKQTRLFTRTLDATSYTATANYTVYSLAPRTAIENSYASFTGSFIGSLRQSMNGKLDIDEDYVFIGLPATHIKCMNDTATVSALCFHTDKYVYLLSVKQHINDEHKFEQFIQSFKFND